MDPKADEAAPEESDARAVEDLETTDEEGSAVKGGITVRKSGGEQQN